MQHWLDQSLRAVSLFLVLVLAQCCKAQWVQIAPPTPRNISCLVGCGGKLYEASQDGGLFLLTQDSLGWISSSTGIEFSHVHCLLSVDSILLAGTEADGVYSSSHYGRLLDNSRYGLEDTRVQALVLSDTTTFAGTVDGVFMHTPHNFVWNQVDSGLTDRRISCLAVHGNCIFAGTLSGVFLSTNDGKIWTSVNNGLMDSGVITLRVIGNQIFAGTQEGLFSSSDDGRSWGTLPHYPTGAVCAIEVVGKYLFLSAARSGIYGDVYRSSDTGKSWVVRSEGMNTDVITSFASIGDNIFAAARDDGQFVSTDNGESWSRLQVRIAPKTIIPFTVHPLVFSMIGCSLADTKYPIVTEISLDAANIDRNQFDRGGVRQDGEWIRCPMTAGVEKDGTMGYKVLEVKGNHYKVLYAENGGGTLTTQAVIDFVVERRQISVDGKSESVHVLRVLSYKSKSQEDN